MTDRYEFEAICPYCKHKQWVLYADEWAEKHTCEKCKKVFRITMKFIVEKEE